MTLHRLRILFALFRLLLLYSAAWLILVQLGLFIREWSQHTPQTAVTLASETDGSSVPFLGITVALEDVPTRQRRAELHRLRNLGFGWVRQRLDWAELEPVPGTFEWQAADALLEDIRHAQLEPVIVLAGSPSWARAPEDTGNQDNPFAPPATPAPFARFSGEFARRYRTSITYYQIWDEPNIAPHWGNRHINPVGYAQLLKSAADSIRAADVNAVIITGALAPTTDRGHLAIDEVYFLQRLYAAGAAPAFDAVAVQPFGFARTPEDPYNRETLNFQRSVLVRKAMVAAGDESTPLWGVRFGWNVRAGSPWSTVPPHLQAAFTRTALDTAYAQWPWMSALGWPIAVPNSPVEDPIWGFALTTDLTEHFQSWSETAALRANAFAGYPEKPERTIILGIASIGSILVFLILWRSVASLQSLPMVQWYDAYLSDNWWKLGVVWAVMFIIYYLATWPPLIVLCWIVAAFLIFRQPVTGVGLAALLLPFYYQHKELALVGYVLAIPPSHAALLCTLPAFFSRPWRRLDRWDWLAGGWLIVCLLGGLSVWHWPAYWRGMIDLVVVPLLLYFAVRSLIGTPTHLRVVLFAMVFGAVLAAAIGIGQWMLGTGTWADGFLRLTRPYFSPNHAALYLERILFVALALVVGSYGMHRLGAGMSATVIAIALALTGSRGAYMLALPVGTWVFARSVQRLHTQPHLSDGSGKSFGRRKMLFGALASLLLIGWIISVLPRLSNTATVIERWEVWTVAWRLWLDKPWTGVGPNGFFWNYPAFLDPSSGLDPNLRHPHSVWLGMATMGGVAGLVWLAAAIAAAWHMGSPRTIIGGGLLAGLFAGFAHGQVDAFMMLPDLAAWNWMAFAFLAGTFVAKQQKSRPKNGSGSL